MRGEPMPSTIRGLSPCAECTERHTACHDNCPKYDAWKAEVQKIKDAKKAYEEKNWRKKWQRKTTF